MNKTPVPLKNEGLSLLHGKPKCRIELNGVNGGTSIIDIINGITSIITSIICITSIVKGIS